MKAPLTREARCWGHSARCPPSGPDAQSTAAATSSAWVRSSGKCSQADGHSAVTPTQGGSPRCRATIRPPRGRRPEGLPARRKMPAEGRQRSVQSADELKAAIEASLTPGADREQAWIAVLPFVNMSGDKETITSVRDLPRRSSTSHPDSGAARDRPHLVVRRRPDGLDVREAGARWMSTASSRAVCGASARGSGSRRVVTASDGSHLWSERFDRELTDILALEDEIAEAIAERLPVELKQKDRGQRRPRSTPTRTRCSSRAVTTSRGDTGRHGAGEGVLRARDRARPELRASVRFAAELYWYLGSSEQPPREAFLRAVARSARSRARRHVAKTHALWACSARSSTTTGRRSTESSAAPTS